MSIDGNPFPVPPRPRYLQLLALLLGIIAVGAGLLGNDDWLLIFCGLSVVANGASLLLEGSKTPSTQRR